MNIILDHITQDNEKYNKYKFYLGFYDKKKKCFNSYISKTYFYNIKNKFNKLNYNKKQTTIYKYLNLQKIQTKDKTNYIKNDFGKYFIFYNKKIENTELNYSFILAKQINYSIINCIDFPNISDDIEIENKEIFTYKLKVNNSIIFVNFEIINEKNYSINFEINFDIKEKNNINKNIVNLLNLIYNNNLDLIYYN